MTDFASLALLRESCRNFSDKAVLRDDIVSILNTALLTPSACNEQPWKLYVVDSAENKAIVAKAVQNRGFNKFAEKAQAFIIVEEDLSVKGAAIQKLSKNDFASMDIGELTAYITLAAQDIGISSCILGSFSRKPICEITGIKDGSKIRIIIALGYTDSSPRPKKRKAFDDTVKFV